LCLFDFAALLKKTSACSRLSALTNSFYQQPPRLSKKLTCHKMRRWRTRTVGLGAAPPHTYPDRSSLMNAMLVQIPAMVDAWADVLRLLRAIFKLFGW
jgi:hypothetical protein